MSAAASPLTLVAETLVSAGETYSVDVRNMRDLCVKAFILSLKYVSRQAVWAAVFPDAFVDWALVRPAANALGDLHLWLPLVELFSWEGVERLEPHHPPLAGMRRAMRAAALDQGSWDLPCQLLLLQMLQGVPCLQALQLMTCRALKRDTHQSCALLLAALSDTPFTPEVCAAALAAVLSEPHLRVDVAPLEAHLRAASTRRGDIAAALRQKSMTSHLGRPRLRDRQTVTDQQKVSLDSALGTWESYTAFCQLHQFPNVLSETVKTRLYFLAAQTAWDWRPHVAAILHHDGDLCARIGKYPVSRPDLRILHRCIEGLAMDGSPPFQEMIDFRNRCFRSFPVSHAQRTNLTQVLRLYVCVYQNPAHWKDLWKQQVPLLSPQIIRDCEAFAAQAPFNAAAFMALFLGPAPPDPPAAAGPAKPPKTGA